MAYDKNIPDVLQLLRLDLGNPRVRTVRGAMPMNTFLEVLNALAGTGTSYIIAV